MIKFIKKNLLQKKPFCLSILLNLIILFLYYLICEVRFDTETDMFLNEILSGSAGWYGSGYGWLHFGTGFFIKGMYRLFPGLPWYALLQYVCILASFILIVFLLMRNNPGWGGRITGILFLLFAGYECYARVSYIKTGVVCSLTAGFILYQMIRRRIRHPAYLPASVMLSVLGYLWYSGAPVLAAIFWILPVLYGLFLIWKGNVREGTSEARKADIRARFIAWKENIHAGRSDAGQAGTYDRFHARKEPMSAGMSNARQAGVYDRECETGSETKTNPLPFFSSAAWRGLLTLLISAVCILALSGWSFFHTEKHPGIKEQIAFDRAWQEINGLGWPDYMENQADFLEMGISQNTYTMLTQGRSMGGYTVSPDTLQKIRELARTRVSEERTRTVLGFTRSYPVHFFDNGLFWGFIPLLVLSCIPVGEKKWKQAVYVILAACAAYAIRYVFGADGVSVFCTCTWLSASVTALGFARGICVRDRELEKYYDFAAVVAVLLIINRQSGEIMSLTDIATPAETAALLSTDREHIYATGNTDLYRKDLPLSRSAKYGDLKNVLICRNTHAIYHTEHANSLLAEDPQQVRFLSEDFAQQAVSYLNEVTGGGYYCVKTGELRTCSFYSVHRDGLWLNPEAIVKAHKKVLSDVTMSDTADGKKVIEGYLYKRNRNSLAQTVYLEIYDPLSKSYSYFDVLQRENPASDDRMNGKYGGIYVEAPVEAGQKVSLILAVDGNMYRVRIKQK